MHNVSVIICIRNCADMIAQCIESVRANKPYEIIVVDGNSTDGSYETAQLLADQVIRDDGRGVSYARRIGTELAEGDYVLHIGPDNILEDNFIELLLKELSKKGYDGVGAQTRMASKNTWWDAGMDDWWQFVRGDIGVRTVIGTPCLFKREILLQEPFSEKPIACDDTELCERLVAQGYKLGLVPVAVLDAGGRTWSDIYHKFLGYGYSDSDYYRLHSKQWTFQRKILSWLHPLKQTMRGLRWMTDNRRTLSSKSFILIIGMIRYLGWIKKNIYRSSKQN